MVATGLSFVQLGDLHFLHEPQQLMTRGGGPAVADPDFHLDWVLRRIQGLRPAPDFIAICGDLVEIPSIRSYERSRSFINELEGTAPVLLGVGNHDDRALFRHVLGPESPTDPAARIHYKTEVEGVRIIMLDSQVPGEIGGELGPEQIQWLDSELTQAHAGGTLVFMHHPVVEPFAIKNAGWGEDWLLADAGALAEVIPNRDVLGILSGHVHISSFALFAGVPVSTAPSTIWMMNAADSSGGSLAGAGFNLGAVRDGQLVVNPILYTAVRP